MPQMSPLMWLILFLLFSTLLILAMIKIYFLNNKNTKLNNNFFATPEKNIKIWQW